MSKSKVIPQRKKLSAVFASFAILIMGTASLTRSMSLDYYTVLCTLDKVMPAAFALGALGWVMGMVLDKPKHRAPINYNKLFLSDVVKDNFPKTDNITDEPDSDFTPEIE